MRLQIFRRVSLDIHLSGRGKMLGVLFSYERGSTEHSSNTYPMLFMGLYLVFFNVLLKIYLRLPEDGD